MFILKALRDVYDGASVLIHRSRQILGSEADVSLNQTKIICYDQLPQLNVEVLSNWAVNNSLAKRLVFVDFLF